MPPSLGSGLRSIPFAAGLATILIAVLIAVLAHAEPPSGTAGAAEIVVVESVPVETPLDLPGLPDAPQVWREMIASAEHSLEIEAFYLSANPDEEGALAPILAEVERASGRGVIVRTLSDAGFHRTYPDVHDRLGALPGAEARLLDARALWGGVQHAKAFIVDGEQFFVGSQNWDWRALEHIHELGVRVRHPDLARGMQAIFEHDWNAAAGESAPSGEPVRPGPYDLRTADGGTVAVSLAASPRQALPPGIPWDEPLLVELMDSAVDTLRLQLLSYNPGDREGRLYDVLDSALRRAATRGVQVRIILSNWAKRSYMLPHIQSLAVLPNVEIRFTNYPEWSGGHVPYGRVDHAKFLVADRRACWVGTANWSRSYFHESRNISLMIEGGSVADDVIDFFEIGWRGPYAETVDPCAEYSPPRIGE